VLHGKAVHVVVPAHNEAAHVADVVRTMPAWVDRVFVVDDASTDGTLEAARATVDGRGLASETGVPVTLLRHSRNRGVGAAIATGYMAALEAGADVVAVMAGDGQMRPEELARVVSPVARGEADYAKGNRLGHPAVRGRMPTVRRWGTSALSLLTGWVAGYPDLVDAQCGYTAAEARVLRRLPLGDLYPRYGYPNDLIVMLGRAGARLAQPVVTPVYAGERSELRPLKALFTHSFVLARAALRRRPMDSRGAPEPSRRGHARATLAPAGEPLGPGGAR